MAVELTPEAVRAFTLPAGSNQRQLDLYDTECPNLYVRVARNKKGKLSKSYRVKYHLGGQRSWKIGPAVPSKVALKTARDRAFEIVAAARKGVDLAAAEKATANRKTVGELVPLYLAARKGTIRERSYEDLDRYLNGAWLRLHTRYALEVRRPDVVAELDRIEADSGPVAADRARSALSGFFDWCVDRNHCEVSPVVRIKSRSTNGSRDRALSPAELRAVWRAAGDDAFGRVVRLLILTGQRKTEVGSLQRSEVNLETRQLELPGERTKNGLPHVIPLAPQAAAQLPTPLPAAPEAFLFGRYDTTGGFSGWGKAKAELDRRITKARGGKPLPHWVLHDLRRTFVTQMSELQLADDDLVELIVNHISGKRRGVAGTYRRSERLEERRAALERWAEWVERLVGASQSSAGKGTVTV